MLDKNAFEKALNEDRANAAPPTQQPVNNGLQFDNQPKPVVQTTGKTKREQLWEQRKMKKASKVSPAFAQPGPVINNMPQEANNPNLNFPGQSNTGPGGFKKPEMPQPESNPSNFQVMGAVEATPLQMVEPNGFDFAAQPNSNAPVSVPSGVPAQNEIMAPPQPPPMENFSRPPPQEQPYQEPQRIQASREGLREKKPKNSEYLNDWKKEMEEREMRKKREREEEKRREREEMEKYSDPFGKAGAGAPIRNNRGQVITNRREAAQESSQQPSYSRVQNSQVNYQPPQMSQPVQQQPTPQPQPSVSYQPPVQPMMPEQNFNQNPYMAAPGPNLNMQNFQPPMNNNNFPMAQPMMADPYAQMNAYPPRESTPPMPNMPNYPVNQAAFPSQPQFNPMPDPLGPLPMPKGNNMSMEIEPQQEAVVIPNRRKIQTPATGGDGLGVGGNQDLLKDNKNRMKNEWQQQLLDQMEQKKRKQEEEKRKRDQEELEEEK